MMPFHCPLDRSVLILGSDIEAFGSATNSCFVLRSYSQYETNQFGTFSGIVGWAP